MRKVALFTIASNKLEYHRINLANQVNVLYSEDSKPPKNLKTILEDGEISCDLGWKSQCCENDDFPKVLCQNLSSVLQTSRKTKNNLKLHIAQKTLDQQNSPKQK